MLNKMKRILALVMSIMMITSSMPVSALADTTTNTVVSTFTNDESATIEYISGDITLDMTLNGGKTELYALSYNVPLLQSNSWGNSATTNDNAVLLVCNDTGVQVNYVPEKKITITPNEEGTVVYKWSVQNSGDVSITVNVAAPKYTIKYVNGAEEKTEQYTGTNVYVGDDGFTADEGKVLYGWSESANTDYLTGTYFAPGATVTGIDGDKIFYAVWGPEVTVSFDANGGEGTVEAVKVKANTAYTLPGGEGLTALANKLFAGWATDAAGTELLQPGSTLTITADTTLYAIWADAATATFVNGDEPLDDKSQTVAAGTEITMPSGDGLTKPEGELSFYGWTTEGMTPNYENETGFYAPGITVLLENDTTFTAAWGPSKLKITVNKNYYYYDTVAHSYKLYETETEILKAHDEAYTVEAKDYPDNVMQLNSNAPTCDAEGAVIVDGTVTFDTQNVMRDEYNGEVNVNFYYDAYYTLDYRAILPYYTEMHQYEPGQTGSFQYGDEALNVVGGALYVVPNVEGLKFNELSGYKNASEVLYKRGYYNGANEPQDYKYSEYDSEELQPFSLQSQPKPGATIYYYYRLKGVGDSSWPGMEKLTFAAYYLNMFNSEMNDAGLWENMTDNIGVEYIYFGETMTFNFPFYWANSYEAGNSSLSTIDYYADSPFVLWKYGMDKNQQYEQPENHTVEMINASSYFFSKGIPEVYIGGVNTIENMRVPLLYNNEKSLFLSVEYYLDGVQIGETEWYRSGEHAQSVSVKPLPEYNGLTFNESDWTVKCIDPLTGGVTEESLVYGNLYDGSGDRDVYGNGGLIKNYKMPDRHIKYYITTNAKTTSSTVEKVWNDNENKAGMRPSILEVKLSNGGTYVLSAKNGWRLTVDGLRKDTSSMPTQFTWDGNKWNAVIDENVTEGNEIRYSWSEKVPEEYTLTNTSTIRNEDGTFTTTLTNTYNSEYVNVSVEKVWDDINNAEGKRPESVKVQLLINGVPSEDEGHIVELNQINGWKYTWSDLDAKLNGKAVEYDVVELTDIAGYTTSKTGSAATGFTITNTLNPILVDVTVKKEWNDAGNQDGLRPTELTVTLSNGTEVVETVELNENNGWTATVENLPKYEKDQLVNYTWTEETVDGYELTTATSDDGYTTTLTNTHTVEKINVSVEKKWEDANDQDGIRPDSITVQLKADGENVGTAVTLPHNRSWSYTWSDLDKNDNGEEIEYTVVEDNVPVDYTSATSAPVKSKDGKTVSYTITNSYTPETTDVTVTKVWNDDNNRDGVRPEKITLLLMNGTTEVRRETVSVPADDSFTYTFEGVPEYADGSKITYTVDEELSEEDAVNYTKSLSGLTVTNIHAIATADVTVYKVWDDANNAAGFRPANVTIKLYANGTKVGEAILSGTGNEWSHTFKNLPVNANGTAITYTVDEVLSDTAALKYSKSLNQDTLTVTNKHTPETTDATVTKVWDDKKDQDGKRPESLTVTLVADNVATDKTVTLNENNNWTATVTGLPKYAKGQEIVYTWQEETVPGYSLTTSKNGTVTTLTNTHTPATIAVSVNKVWDDENNQDGKQPESVTVCLLANGVETGSVVLDASNNWKHDFVNLPKYKAGEKDPISYTVTEDAVDGYVTSIPAATKKDGDVEGWDYTITNTHELEKTTATVVKVWNDNENQDGIRPTELKVTLSNGMEVTLNEANNWTATVEDLPKYLAGSVGQEIKYTWSETVPEGYSKTENDVIEGTKTTITNNYTPGETSVTVTKSWDDADNQDGIRPTSVQVQLYADGTAEGAVVELNEGNKWSYTWSELPLKADGKAIAYTVDETEKPDGYTKTFSGNASKGFTIKNSHIPATTEVTVTKVWADDSDQDGIRPDSVKLQLYADGKAYGQAFELTDEGDEWTEEITGLPMYNGVKDKPIVWTVKEVTTPDGYTKSESGLTVTNTHTPELTEATVKKVWDDADNQDAIRPTSLTINLLADGKATDKSVTLPVNDKWEATLTGLDKYADGQEIVYTWQEETVSGYSLTTSKDGTVTTLTNSYTPKTTEVTVKKVWDDAEDQDRKRPASLTVTLSNGTATVATVTLNKENSWIATVDQLPMNANGKAITYTWQEDEDALPDGYELTGNVTENGVTTLTNSYTPETTEATVKKVWNDANDQDGLRPDELKVTLSNGEIVTLNETNGWTATVKDLPKYADGIEIAYTWTEDRLPEGYSLSGTSKAGTVTTLTNTHTPDTIDLQVTKNWVDDNDRDRIRPASVTVQLMADEKPCGDAVTLSASNNWSHKWENLAKNSAGKPIVYTVAETDVPEGYKAEVEGTIAGGFVITNRHTPATTSVTATKVWVDNDNQDGKRTDVTLTLYKTVDGEKTAVGSQSIPANATGDALTVTWNNLPKFEAGVEIIYTVTEDQMDGYSTVITGDAKDGYIVTNTHKPEEITISGVKKWDDADDQDGLRLGAVTINLYADDAETPYRSTMATDEDEWTWSFTGLPKYRDQGVEIKYTVEEVVPNGYTPYITVNEAGTYTIKNTHTPDTTTISGIKKWEDAENQDGIRPASVTINLYDGGEEPVQTTTATAEGGWAWSFSNLPVNKKTAAGSVRITYTVKEADVPAGYTSAQSEDATTGFITITNTHTPETITVSGTKTWNDNSNQDGKRPASIIVHLLADGKDTGKSAVVTGKGNEWSYTFADVPKYRAGAVKQEIEYSVSEDQVNEYSASYSGMNITNSYTPGEINFSGTKVWDDANNQDGKRPKSITIHLWKTVGDDSSYTGKSVTLTNETSWSFEKLPEYEGGKLVTYYVQEDAVEGYTTTYSTDYKTITNTHTPETTTVSGTKTWNDNNNQDGKRPDSITVQLKADGVALADKVATVTPDTEGNWNYSFTGLPKYKIDETTGKGGKAIVYTITEDKVDSYETSYVGFDIKNTHTIEKVSINGTKVWKDAEDQDGARPDSITINLKKGNVVLQTKEVSEVNGKWEFSFTNLDKYENGALIDYTIEEVRVSDYKDPVVSMTWNKDHTEANVTVTNTHDTEETEVTVTKNWVDGEDQDGIRPDSITVNLLADGEQIDSATVTAENGWEYTFTELPKFADGKEIEYTITETPVEGYKTAITGTAAEGFTVTNTHTPEETEVSVTKAWEDEDDQDGLRPASITVQLYADGKAVDGKVATISANEQGEWKHSFTGLPKYRNVNGEGVEIKYTISEAEVKNYTTEIDGFAITNSHTPATVDVEGTKTWVDADDQDGLRPESITVQLLADGEVKETKTVTAADGWTWKWENLPKYKLDENNKGGNEIVYTVKEVMDDNTAKAYTSTVTGYNIINTHTPEVVTVAGAKNWDDNENQDGKRPTEITINLLADGIVKESKTVTANDGWAWTWENLPKYKFNENGKGGKEIVYSITEEKVTNYNDPIYDGYNVTNTHTIEKVTVAGRKSWNDFDNVAGIRPESIIINLLADGTIIDSKTVTADDGWTWKWENLDKYAAGKEIKYTITESAVANYTTDVQGYNVENIYTPGKTSVTVTKAWNDDGNRDGLRPASITVKLLADGVEYKTAELTAPSWSATFEDLPIYKEGKEGVAVVYTVAEEQVKGYELPAITGNATKGYTITNTHNIATTKVEGTKVWIDENDQDGIRKESVTINLLANGNVVDSATVDEASDWKFSFDNLPVNENGKAITYTVSEDKVEGYETAITGTAAEGFTVTNTHTPEETAVSVTKAWKDANDQDGLRPDFITIKLAANGQAVANADVKAVEGWSYKFTKLPKYASGKEIAYTVEELTVPGYETTEITGTAAGGYTITNTHTPGVTSVSGTKTWNDAENQDGKRPASITVNLLADGEQIDSATVTAENGWKYSFTGLPTHAEGKKIAYSVEEVLEGEDAKNYTPSYTSTENGYDITNTHEVEKTEVEVTKVWNDKGNQDNKRAASVTINLLADGDVAETVELNDINNWTYTFENLDKYSEGAEIEYTVEEANVPEGYTVAVDGDAATGYTVTNTHDIDTTEVAGAKTWTDNDDQDGKRPESIIVNLLADGEIIKTATVTADNGWKWSFTDLPVNKAGKVGQAIDYTITENTVDGYTTEVNGYDITNTHEIEKVSINGTKEWQDANDQDGLRPESITIKLLKNGESFMITTATEEGEWKWSFNDLDKYEKGEEIAYSIEEIAVEGYETTGEKLVWNETETVATVALVNTHTPATTDIKVTKTWVDNDNQDGKRPTSIKVQLLADEVQVDEVTIVADQDDKWEHTFTNLPVKAAGEDIAYTITETPVDGYTTDIDGFAITNTHTPETTSITGEKIWSDAENQDGKRPASINVNLLANGTEIKNVDVAADVNGDWKFSFTDLPAYADGKLITYTVTEDEVDEYSTAIETDEETGFITITNSYTPGKTSISGEKFWVDADDQDGLRPESITVNLVATVDAINYHQVAKTVTVTAEDGWKYTFTELPTHVAGKEIEYTVEEVLPENLKGIYTSEVNGNNITNTHTPYTTSISGEKIWDDADDQDGKRPDSITVNLLANGEKVKSATVTADGNGKWLYTFDDLPVNKDGAPINYTVTEEPVVGYTAAVENFNITNTHDPETTSISGMKTWNDAENQDGKRPEEITVNLLVVKGEDEYELIDSQTVTADEEWKYTFDNLPVYAKGEKITYKVTEVAVNGYTAEYEGNNIKNTHLVEKTEVKVTKDWNDAENQDGIRPESVIINLLADGAVAKTIELNDSIDWTYTFENLDKYSKGVAIKYTVEEVTVPEGYTVAVTGDTATGYTVTNTHETDKTSISGQKTWDDLDNEKGIRPTEITVKVMNGNEVVATKTVSEKDGWKYTFTGLEKNANGQEIEYTIAEEPVEGYTAEVTDYDILNKTEVPKISVTKTADELEKKWKVGETVTYTIVVKNTGNVDLLNVKVEDEQTNLYKTIDLLPKGESTTLTTEHTITEEDLLAGEYVNIAKAEGTSPEGEKTEDEESETVETDAVKPGMEVTKTADVTKDVKVGDTITYTITVKNTGNVTLKDIIVEDDLTGDTWKIDELAVGATSEPKQVTYIVTEADLLKHQIKNIATATTTNPDDPTEEVTDDDDEIVETEEVKPGMEVTKTADVTKDVKVGDTITYTITVKNTGNVTLKDIIVEDDLTGDTWKIDELAVDATSDKLIAKYVVTSDDILKGSIKNIATAETTNPDNPDEPVKDDDDEVVDPEPIDTTLTVVKTSDKQGKKVALGEEIKYTITVKNDGNVDYTNVKVDDELTGDHWTIELLKVGEEKEFTTTYTVTSEDILAGTVLNSVTAKGDDIPDPDPDVPPHTPEGEDDEEDDPEDIDTTLTVVKTSDKQGKKVALGEEIKYTITVKNDGNVDYTNVKVDDELTGDHWTIELLKVGEEKEFTTTYTVTSEDILAGTVLNSVTAKGDDIPDPDPDVPPHTPEGEDDEEDDPEDIDTTLTVVKTSDKQGKKVALGEEIKYTITVKNDGNVDYTNVKVDDELTGDHWTIELLKVGEEKEFTTTYTVTSDDILAGTVLNSVTAKGDDIPDPDPDVPPHTPEGEDDEEDDPEDIDTTLTVVKTSDVTTTAQVGDTITYTIVVKNDGNVDYTNVKVDDELTGLHETIEVLKVGESQTFTTTRVVTAADAAAGHILNVAVAKADPIPDPDDPDQPKVPEGSDDEDDPVDPVPVVPEIYRVTVRYWYEYVGGETAAKTFTQQYATGDPYAITSPKVPGYTADILRVTGVMEKQDMVYDVIYTANEYKLTIEYIYLDGGEAAPTYTDTLKAGDEYYVESPVINGYRANVKVVEGTMPARDMKYTVVYVKNGDGYIIIDDYDTPLGIGNVHLNAGECFE